MASSKERKQNEKAVRLVDYLMRLASLRAELVRDIAEYEKALWVSAIPHERGCFAQAWGRDEEHEPDEWLEVQNRREPELPAVPAQCKDWIDQSSLRNKSNVSDRATETVTDAPVAPKWAAVYVATSDSAIPPESREELSSRPEQRVEERQADLFGKVTPAFAFHIGQRVRFTRGKRTGAEATVVALVSEGRLVLRTDDGKVLGENAGISPENLETVPSAMPHPAPDHSPKMARACAYASGVQPPSTRGIVPWPAGDRNGGARLLPEITSPVKSPNWREGSDQAEYIPRTERLEDHPEVQQAWDRYIEDKWLPWTEEHNTWEKIHKVYSALFAIHQEQLRLGEEYELVFGLGLLTWQTPTGQRVRRHLIVADAMLEFEARLGKFTVRPHTEGAGLRPELGMLDIEEQPARAEETAKSSLANAGDDPWDKGCVEGVLQALVHSINSQGEYEDRLEAKSLRASEKPIVEYAPALILRRRSAKGLTEALKRIKEQIEEGEDIPIEFADLAEIRARGDVNTVDDPGDTSSAFDGEVFFPKPSNEEQRRIVDKIRATSGVLVQGPPGTGKSHTIANLICHLLATGQRTLITAKTPRALQVLEGLVPNELRPLCINLLGSGLEEKRSLECSVGGILRRNEEWNEDEAKRECEDLGGKLQELREEKVKVERRLRDIRESETHSQSVAEGAYRGTAARIAQAVNRDRSTYEWFKDNAPLNQPCPIRPEDLLTVVHTLRRSTPYKRQQLKQKCPEPNTIPAPQRFAELAHREKRTLEDANAASQSLFIMRRILLRRARLRRQQIEEEILQIEGVVSSCAARTDAHPLSNELLQAIRNRDVDAYAHAANKVQDLDKERQRVQEVDQYISRLRRLVPRLTDELRRTCSEPCWEKRIQHIQNAWRWAQARCWIEEYIRQEDVPALAQRAKQIEDEINATIAKLASLHAWSFCFSRLKENHRRHMEAWQQSMRRLGKGTGKHAPRHRREAQQHLNECRDAVPAWVMPLHRVWDTVDTAPGIFDVIIVDEASQCGVEALPLFYLGKKILIVGDDKQISPDAVGLPRDAVHRLMEEFLHDFRFKSSFDIESSLFDHGKLRYGTRRITLREHFRCMPEIIRFSNNLCYSDTPLIPLRQYGPDRLTPLEHVFVSGGYREGAYNRAVNRPEAEVIVDKIAEMCGDKRYDGKTMGVVVLQGEAQAGLIEGQLLERLGAEEMGQRRLVCGNPYSFQGDERDIILLSMVAATNERIGPLVKATDERRFNVAASRARDNMILFHSVNCDDLSTSCLRRRLLEFFESTKPQEIAGISRDELERSASQDNRSIVKAPPPFESWFEVDVALELLHKGFVVLPQHEIAGKRIDLVVEGGQARLAVECDGDPWHGAEHYEADMQRQRQLERCGWEFFRVRESAFYSDKESALQGLWRLLDERGIHPFVTGAKTEKQTPAQPRIEQRKHDDGDSVEAEKPVQSNGGTEQAIKVRVGSTVVYVNEDGGQECQALITTERSNPEWGTINANTPVAKALIGAEIGQIVVAHLPVGSARLRVVDIR